jgi:hypothetical protein
MTTAIDWLEWHKKYDEPDSRLSQRLRVVQQRIGEAIDAHPGAIRLISMCAGQGRDVLGVLADHPRRDDVSALLVELDPRNVEIAQAAIDAAGLTRVRIACADAALTDSYADAVPADIVMACGVFGNIPDDEIMATIAHLPHWCAPGATVLWTRALETRDVVGAIRQQFERSGFAHAAFDAPGDETFRVGAERLVVPPRLFEPGRTLFTFTRGHIGTPGG